ncbi:MAG: T9SS type A sorting domain-containing protein [candidate division Zixibacteria bacterium]|nr:T9SS type A sorting domain-containing protein [candidate division Zixibacteria bacterium]
MIRTFKKLSLLLTLLLGFALSVSADPDAYTGVVTIDNVIAEPGDKVSVEIRLKSNNASISAMSIPIKFPSVHLNLDSVSYTNSLAGVDFSKDIMRDNSLKIAKLFLYPSLNVTRVPTITAETGLIATLHFSVGPIAPPSVIPVDSLNLSLQIGNITVPTRVEFSDNAGLITYLPGFERGSVTIQIATGIDDGNGLIPLEFALAQNYPNPFNPTTQIAYSLPKAGQVKLEVFNILGQSVATLVDKRQEAGAHTVNFDALEQPSGVYFYRLATESDVKTKKMLLMK